MGLRAQPDSSIPQVSFAPAWVTNDTINGLCYVTHPFSPVSQGSMIAMTGSWMWLPAYGALWASLCMSYRAQQVPSKPLGVPTSGFRTKIGSASPVFQ